MDLARCDGQDISFRHLERTVFGVMLGVSVNNKGQFEMFMVMGFDVGLVPVIVAAYDSEALPVWTRRTRMYRKSLSPDLDRSAHAEVLELVVDRVDAFNETGRIHAIFHPKR